jgi:hypothetical protein
MTPEDAHRRCKAACDADDIPAAEYWLLVCQTLNREAEDAEIAQAVRDTELWVMAAACDWWWPDAG